MVSVIKSNFIASVEYLHLKIFGHKMGSEMRLFLSNLKITTISTIFSGVIMLLVNVLAGRFMGPVEYGKYQLAYSIANILIIFILVGINISVARSGLFFIKNKPNIIGTSFWFTVINIIIIGLIAYFMRDIFLKFNISEKVVIFSIFFSASFAFYNITKSYFQAEQEFKFIAKSEILNYLVVAISFAFFMFFGRIGFEYILLTLIFGYATYSLVGIYKLRSFLWRFQFNILIKLMRYGFLAFFVVTSGFIISSFNRILINNFLGERDLGIYSAYFLSSTIFVMFIVKVFSLVFFPTVAKIEERKYLKVIIEKIERLEIIFSLPVLCINFFSVYIFMKVYGSDFNLDFYYLLIISISSTFLLFMNIRQWFLAAAGEWGIKISLKIAITVAFLSVFYYIILIDRYGLLGSFIALLLVNLTFYFLNYFYIRKEYDHLKNY